MDRIRVIGLSAPLEEPPTMATDQVIANSKLAIGMLASLEEVPTGATDEVAIVEIDVSSPHWFGGVSGIRKQI